MSRILRCLAALLLVMLLAVPASAATGASSARVDAVLDHNGDCQVTLSMTLQMDQATELWVPIPGNARSISINGSGASTDLEGDVLYVDLSEYYGTVILRYTVPNTVSYTEEGFPVLELPLLSGFAYPIEQFDFSLTLPEPVAYTPNFSSGYHQTAIESNLIYSTQGNQITGSADAPMKDRETLTLSLRLTEETFPRSVVEPWGAGTEDTIALVLAILGILYWLIFLRAAPLIRRRNLNPPEGVTAGEMRCVLTGQGADLTMTVFTWAQLGYILIHLKRNGQVTLHKRMEMGNERGAYERKLFRTLFGKKNSVDGTGYHYATLAANTAASRGSVEDLFKSSSGNPRILQWLGVAVGVCCGISLAIALAGDALLAVLVMLLMAVAGGVGAWVIQRWVEGLHLRNRRALLLGLGVSLLWIGLGIMGNESLVAALAVGFQLLIGLGIAYGGRRTPYGRQVASQILGLRANLCRLPADDLDRIRRDTPDLFFDFAPYAMALGADKAFARQFGRQKLSPCSWLTSGADHQLTADQWRQLLHRTANILDERKKRLLLERLLGK